MAKRQSKYRHIYGDPAKPEAQFTEIKNPLTSGEGSYVSANATYFAVAQASGGGPLLIRRLDKPGRVSANSPVLSVHKGKTWDFDFHPFISTMVATGSEDTRVCVSQFPAAGLSETITDATVTLQGHEKKVTLVTWNPSANNILASGSFDRTVKVWNIETSDCLSSFDENGDNIYSLKWNYDGSLLAVTGKDKKLRVYDPRQPDSAQCVEAFDGTKSSKVFWAPKLNWIGATGFSKSAKRQLKLWDARKLEDKPLYENNIDAAASVLVPNFDDDNGVLYLAAKGGGSIQFFELVNDDRKVYTLGVYRNPEPQKGGGWVFKRGLDVFKCEVARFLKLTSKSVIPISFIVPRKAGGDVFQADIFPDAAAPAAALSAEEWIGGQNKDPVLMSLDPAKRGDDEGEQKGFEKKKTYKELLDENADLKKQVKELQKQVAELKGEDPSADDDEKQD